MDTNDCGRFDWEELCERIHKKKVIPVIGQGLYRVETGTGDKPLLYDFIADELPRKTGMQPVPEGNHRFSKAAFQFLKENKYKYRALNKLLREIIQPLRLPTDGPLRKLARIKPFSLFINTTYDDTFTEALAAVRDYPVRVLNHTTIEKKPINCAAISWNTTKPPAVPWYVIFTAIWKKTWFRLTPKKISWKP